MPPAACGAFRRAEPVDWVAGIVPRSPEAVREAIAGKRRVEILIKNTANETVIGGSRRVVEEVVAALKTSVLRGVHRQHGPLLDRPRGRAGVSRPA